MEEEEEEADAVPALIDDSVVDTSQSGSLLTPSETPPPLLPLLLPLAMALVMLALAVEGWLCTAAAVTRGVSSPPVKPEGAPTPPDTKEEDTGLPPAAGLSNDLADPITARSASSPSLLSPAAPPPPWLGGQIVVVEEDAGA